MIHIIIINDKQILTEQNQSLILSNSTVSVGPSRTTRFTGVSIPYTIFSTWKCRFTPDCGVSFSLKTGACAFTTWIGTSADVPDFDSTRT